LVGGPSRRAPLLRQAGGPKSPRLRAVESSACNPRGIRSATAVDLELYETWASWSSQQRGAVAGRLGVKRLALYRSIRYRKRRQTRRCPNLAWIRRKRLHGRLREDRPLRPSGRRWTKTGAARLRSRGEWIGCRY